MLERSDQLREALVSRLDRVRGQYVRCGFRTAYSRRDPHGAAI
jgi:hypothetical protein